MFYLNINNFCISTIWWGDIYSYSEKSWIGYMEITIGTIGSILTIVGVILTIRFDKNFIIPLIIGETLIIIDAIILGTIFTAISYSLMIISALYNYIEWNKGLNENTSKMNLIQWIIVFIFLFIYIIFGSAIVFRTKYYNENYLFGLNDVISSGIVVASWYIILKKSKWGFIGFIITDLTYLILFTTSGLIVTGSSYIVYLIIDSISFISWI